MLISGQTVLDVGCGIGHLVPYIRSDAEYVGVDNSEEMLKAHESFFQSELLLMDATKLDNLGQFETTVSVSLMLHLEHDVAIQVLQQMWEHTEYEMVFSMETCGNQVKRRESGIILRNQRTKDVHSDLVEHLEVRPEQISWGHQTFTYETLLQVTPSKLQPMSSVGPNMIGRTTLFSVTKQEYKGT